MTQSARTRDRHPMDASAVQSADWEALKQSTQLGDFVMTCPGG